MAPIAVRISPKKMSREDYERVIADLERPGEGAPEGRSFHAAYGSADDVQIFELWQSQEHFEAHRDRLVSRLQSAGVDAADIEIHNVQRHHRPD